MTFCEFISMFGPLLLVYAGLFCALMLVALVLAIMHRRSEINSRKAARNARKDFGAVGGPPRFVRCAACNQVSPLDALTVKCPCGNVLSRWHSYAA